MKLTITPLPPGDLIALEPELIVIMEPDKSPEVFIAEGLPKPDRHLLLGLIQAAAFAVEERDAETVVPLQSCTAHLERDGSSKELVPELVVVREFGGRITVFGIGDPAAMRSVARRGLRWFTGTVRLDIP